MMKDEADVVAGTVRHMAGEVDRLLVADNGSTDGTRDILDQLAAELGDRLDGQPRLIVVDDPDPAYFQSRKMSALAGHAAAAGADWIVPFDADELWHAPGGVPVRDVLASTDFDNLNVATAALYNHLRTALDEDVPDPFQSMVWRSPLAVPLQKVAFRWEPGAIVHQGNHGVTLPSGGRALPALVIRHFPVRSPDQFASKVINGYVAYQKTDLPESEGAHWRAYGCLYEQGGRATLNEVYHQHWWYLSPVDSGLVRDPAPYRRWEPQ